MDAIIVRRDVQGKLVVFFPDSYSKTENKIQYYSGEDGPKKVESSADYYFTSKPADENEIKEMSAKFAKDFNSKEILIRRRLIKEHVMARNTEHFNADAAEGGRTAEEMREQQKAFAEKLIAAVTKAIREAIPA